MEAGGPDRRLSEPPLGEMVVMWTREATVVMRGEVGFKVSGGFWRSEE